jgi:hypothetical protein
MLLEIIGVLLWRSSKAVQGGPEVVSVVVVLVVTGGGGGGAGTVVVVVDLSSATPLLSR